MKHSGDQRVKLLKVRGERAAEVAAGLLFLPVMKPFLLWIAVTWFWISPVRLGAAQTSLDLAGRWNGVVEFGKFKFKMQLRVVPDDSGRRLRVTLNNPEQGIREMPVSALLFNPPAVRIELDMFGTAFNGKLSEDGNTIAGELEEGPGGRPVSVTYTRDLKPDPADLPRSFQSAVGDAPDMRGYWTAVAEVEPGLRTPISLRIGRLSDGTFAAALDSFEQGRTDMVAKSASWTNAEARLEWQSPELAFTGRLAADNQSLEGEWKHGKTAGPIRFTRLESADTALPAKASLLPGPDPTRDFRGQWQGFLEIPGANKIRLALKIGELPDHRFVGTLSSLDQGAMEFRFGSVWITNATIHAESRVIHGSYVGTLNPEGQEITGKWEQNGQAMNLKLRRSPAKATPAR